MRRSPSTPTPVVRPFGSFATCTVRLSDADTDDVHVFDDASTCKDIFGVTDEVAQDGFSIFNEGQDSIWWDEYWKFHKHSEWSSWWFKINFVKYFLAHTIFKELSSTEKDIAYKAAR